MAASNPPVNIQTLSRLLDPISSTNSQSVFVIPANGSAQLKNDLMLHVGATITIAQGAIPTYNALLGGYALLREIQILDQNGRSLYHLKNAAQFSNLMLLRSSASYNYDLEYEPDVDDSAAYTNGRDV